MITIQKFGTLPNGENVQAFTLRAPNGTRAQFLSYGATLQSFCLPNGQDIVLGFDSLEPYLGNHGYIGAIIGRVSNRIKNAKFEIEGQSFSVCANENGHALHGGPDGFDRINWHAEIDGQTLIFRHSSPDGHQGYPGKLDVELRYALDDQGLRLDMRAITDAPTPVSLTAHNYFNLGDTHIKNHALSFSAESFCEVDKGGIPIAEKTVEDSAFDFRASRKIADTEIDHHFTVAGTGLREMARLFSPKGDIRLRILSDLPGLQIYTAHQLKDIKAGGLQGKNEHPYGNFAGIAFEPQFPPNAINGPNSESVILRPDQVWAKTIILNVETLGPKDS